MHHKITKITAGHVSLYTVPTESSEADGTFAWSSTTMVLVELECGSTRSSGFTYAGHSTAVLTAKLLSEIAVGSDPFCHAATLQKLFYDYPQSRRNRRSHDGRI